MSNQTGNKDEALPRLQMDVTPGQRAEVVFWSLWQNRETLVQDAAVTLAHGDIDSYLQKQEDIGWLSEMITDLFISVNDCADRLSRSNKDSRTVIWKEQQKEQWLRESKAELVERLKK